MPEANDVAILRRIIQPERPVIPRSLARLILKWEFTPGDRARMHELLEGAKAGRLSAGEKIEAESYERIGHLLSMLKSKARISLKAKAKAS